MGRAFTEEERYAIRLQIKQIAKRMFEAEGLKNFRIQQLTKEVGISLGGFYTFFENKEALYKEIIEDEKNRIRHKILDIIKEEEQSPGDLLTEVAFVVKEKVQFNKLYSEKEEQLANMLGSLMLSESPSNYQANLKFLDDAKTIWESKGHRVCADSKEILGTLMMIGTLCQTQKKMEDEVFDKLYKRIVQSLLEGI